MFPFSKNLNVVVNVVLAGSLKIWDFGSGQEIKCKTGKGEDNDYSVTGLAYCTIEGERCVIGAGWNNKLKIFLVSTPVYSQLDNYT